MSEHVTMPALGESVTEGTVTRWLKQVGEEVAVDEPLLEVSTDKVDTEIPSPVGGTVQEILVQEDETVPVGADLAVIGEGAPSSGGSSDDDSEDDSDSEEASQAEEPQQSEEPAQNESAGDDDSQSSDSAEADDSGSSSKASGGEVSGGEKITMPALGESVTEGTITRWLKAEGDDVEMDEPLLEVSTDKVDTEVPSPAAGKLTKILVQEDETVPVGADLAVIGGEVSGGSSTQEEPKQEAPKEEPKQEAPQEEPKKQEAPKEEPKQEAPQEEPKKQEPQADRDGDAAAYVTPLVRKLASENGVDLASLTGTGVGGRIRKQDVLDAAAKAKEPEPEPAAPQQAPAAASSAPSTIPQISAKRGTTEKMTRMRKLIATRMVESLQVSAQLTTVVEVDVTKIARLRAKAKAGFEQREGVKLSFLPFFALATVEALKAHPTVNASVEDDSIVYHSAENLGIAVDTEKGLFVPVIQNAGDLNIAGLARKIADLAARTRDNKVTPDELGGGTFTLTNTGSRGALFDTPIINQPQVGILGTGTVVKRPVVVTGPEGDETIAVRSMCYLALSYDHRIVDGADAARFLGTVKARLEEGAFEV